MCHLHDVNTGVEPKLHRETSAVVVVDVAGVAVPNKPADKPNGAPK